MPPFALEDFDACRNAPAPTILTEAEIEEVRRQAYENGFQAGAADAMAAAHAEEARLSAELVGSVQDLSFGFHEASAHVMANVAPVLKALVDTVLPRMMAETVGRTILDTVEPLIAEAAGIPARLLLSAEDASAVRAVIEDSSDVPVVIVEDPALESGHAHLRIGAVEREINIPGVLERISSAVDAVTELNTRKNANG